MMLNNRGIADVIINTKARRYANTKGKHGGSDPHPDPGILHPGNRSCSVLQYLRLLLLFGKIFRRSKFNLGKLSLRCFHQNLFLPLGFL